MRLFVIQRQNIVQLRLPFHPLAHLSVFFAILTQENQIAKSRFLRLRALHASLRKWVGFSAKLCYDKVNIY